MVGYAAGTSTDIDIFEAIRHAVTINVGMAGHRASFEAMIRAIEVNKICPTRGAIYKASEFRLALARIAQGGHLGKIVMELGDGCSAGLTTSPWLDRRAAVGAKIFGSRPKKIRPRKGTKTVAQSRQTNGRPKAPNNLTIAAPSGLASP